LMAAAVLLLHPHSHQATHFARDRVCISVKADTSALPSSLPMPLCRKPPNGPQVTGVCSLTQTAPSGVGCGGQGMWGIHTWVAVKGFFGEREGREEGEGGGKAREARHASLCVHASRGGVGAGWQPAVASRAKLCQVSPVPERILSAIRLAFARSLLHTLPPRPNSESLARAITSSSSCSVQTRISGRV